MSEKSFCIVVTKSVSGVSFSRLVCTGRISDVTIVVISCLSVKSGSTLVVSSAIWVSRMRNFALRSSNSGEEEGVGLRGGFEGEIERR